MNITDFRKRLITELKEFEANWKHAQKKNKYGYPDELLFREWVEQFLAFLEIKGVA